MARPTLRRLAVAICLFTVPAVADAAPPPWSAPLSVAEETAVLDEIEAHEQLDERDREQRAANARAGKLLVTGECARVDSDDERIPSAWFGEVESVATLRISNLSDRTVWLVDLRIADADEHGRLGVARMNLPFLPPHSQAEVTMGCDGVHPFAVVLERVRVSGSAAPLTRVFARRLATTPSRFDSSARLGNLIYARAAGAPSLAALALPRVAERTNARLLMAAALADRPSTKSIGEWLGPAGVEAAQGIVDALLEEPRVGLDESFDEILDTALEFGSGTNRERDHALARLLCPIRDSLAAEQRKRWLVDALSHSQSAGWNAAVLAACPLDAEELGELIAAFPFGSHSLQGFIAHAPADTFELAVPVLLGVDGDQRPLALWRAMASLPEPSRLAALEALIRPEDVEAALPLLLDDPQSEERLALFDRIAARVDELPPEQRGAALVPTMKAAERTNDPALMQRLLDLAEHDRATLRPWALRPLAKRQRLLSADGLAALPHRDGIVELVDALSDCPESLAGLRRCLDAFAADPELERAASLGLHEEFLADAGMTLTIGDPTAEQAALIRAYLAYGLDIDAIAQEVCGRAGELLQRDAELDSHLDFLREFAPTHSCTTGIHERIRAAERRPIVVLVVLVVAFALIGLGLAYNRRSSSKLDGC